MNENACNNNKKNSHNNSDNINKDKKVRKRCDSKYHGTNVIRVIVVEIKH